MRTVTFQAIIDTAGELAARTRENLPVEEYAMLRGFLTADLLDLWTAAPWPELIPDAEEIAVVNRVFSKREGEANEIGMIVGVWRQNPLLTTKATMVRHHDAVTKVLLDETSASVFVEYLQPVPRLAALNTAAFNDYELPERFLGVLPYRGAALLLDADQQMLSSDRMLGRAMRALQNQIENLSVPPWREGYQARTAFSQTVRTANATA